MRLLLTFARAYPGRGIAALACLIVAGLVEGFGLSALLPLLTIATNSQTLAGGVPQTKVLDQNSGVGHFVIESLSMVGLEPTIGSLLSVVVAALVLKSGLLLLAKSQVGFAAAHIATDLRLKLLRALTVTRWEFYVRQKVGTFANAFGSETRRASQAFLEGTTLVALGIQATVYSVIAFFISWQAVLVALTAGMLIMLPLNRFVRKSRSAGKRQTKLRKSLVARLTDTLISVKSLRAMGRERSAETILTRETGRLNKALRKKVLSKESLKAAQDPIFAGLLATGLYFAVVRWSLPLAEVAVVAVLLKRVLGHLGKVQQTYQLVAASESAYWSLSKTMSAALREREDPLGTNEPTLETGIRFDRVSFTYGEGSVLQDTSLAIPAGSFTAIVGPSGTGKTTVVDLVTALLRPTEGQIYIDDVPMSQIDLKSWRRMIGYVPQETLLLHDSVFLNVTLGEPDTTEEHVRQALRAAGAWEFVAAMPDGVHSTVGERGSRLSGGQRQRIAIARALVLKPKLLILDEPTTALDPETEAAICGTLESLRNRLTILAISHQPALVKAADRVYQLQNGTAVPIQAGSEGFPTTTTEDNNFMRAFSRERMA